MNVSGTIPVKGCHESLSIFANVLLTLTTVLIIALNTLGLAVLRRAGSIQETTKMFTVSLTVSDLLGGLFVAIPQVIDNVTGQWTLGNFFCVAIGVVNPIFLTTNVLSLLLLTIDRFIAIVYALHYPRLMTLVKEKVMITILWLVCVMTMVLLFGVYMNATIELFPEGYQCIYKNDGPEQLYLYMVVIMFTISFGIILMLYVCILKVARGQARRIAMQNHAGCPLEGVMNAQRPISTKSATTVIIITGAVGLCWMPKVIVFVLFIGNGTQLCRGLVILMDTAFLINSWLNMVIYYWRNRELRHALQGLLRSCCH